MAKLISSSYHSLVVPLKHVSKIIVTIQNSLLTPLLPAIPQGKSFLAWITY